MDFRTPAEGGAKGSGVFRVTRPGGAPSLEGALTMLFTVSPIFSTTVLIHIHIKDMVAVPRWLKCACEFVTSANLNALILAVGLCQNLPCEVPCILQNLSPGFVFARLHGNTPVRWPTSSPVWHLSSRDEVQASPKACPRS